MDGRGLERRRGKGRPLVPGGAHYGSEPGRDARDPRMDLRRVPRGGRQPGRHDGQRVPPHREAHDARVHTVGTSREPTIPSAAPPFTFRPAPLARFIYCIYSIECVPLVTLSVDYNMKRGIDHMEGVYWRVI